jgi:hypothetical protein
MADDPMTNNGAISRQRSEVSKTNSSPPRPAYRPAARSGAGRQPTTGHRVSCLAVICSDGKEARRSHISDSPILYHNPPITVRPHAGEGGGVRPLASCGLASLGPLRPAHSSPLGRRRIHSMRSSVRIALIFRRPSASLKSSLTHRLCVNHGIWRPT